MKHLFVPYETKIPTQLKEKGFNEPCFGDYRQWDGCKPWLEIHQDTNPESTSNYTVECLAPTYQQVVDWFQKVHNIDIRTVNNSSNFLTIKIYKIRKFKDDTFQLEEINTIGTQFNIFETDRAFDKAFSEALKLI